MADARWKALVPLVVAGKPVAAGKTFSAPQAAVQEILIRGQVERVETKRKA